MGVDHNDIPYRASVGVGRAYEVDDVMWGYERIESGVLDKGFVALVDIMPRLVPKGLTADTAIVQAARVSYDKGTKKKREDEALLRYLMRHNHSSPFEQVETKWHCKMPLFLARQWVRHRTAQINEKSGRYLEMALDFYHPESTSSIRKQSSHNKQGSDGFVSIEVGEKFMDYLLRTENLADIYEDLCKEGVDRGLARIGLPLSIYTEWYWKIDLKNLMHFLNVRMHKGAQEEMRQYARSMLEIMKVVCPVTMRAFKDYVLDSVTFTGPEIKFIRGGDNEMSEEEMKEFEKKRPTLA